MSERLIENFREAICIPSVTGNEDGMGEFLSRVAIENGLRPIEQQGNILLHLPGADRSRALIYNGHMDVVGAGDTSLWDYDPYGGETVDSRIYGRGTADMKSGLMAGFETMLRLSKRASLPYDVWFTGVRREETDGNGTRVFADWFHRTFGSSYKEVSAILAEPTMLAEVHNSSLGNAAYIATIEGEAGHSARPDAIFHAPYAGAELIMAIQDLHQSFRERYANSKTGQPAVTVTSYEAASDASNKIAASATINIDLRTIAGMHDDAITTLERVMMRWGATWEPAFTPPFDPAATDKGAKIIRAIQKVAGDIPVTPFQASSDMGPLSRVGIDTVIFGPGDLALAHKANESIDLEQLVRAGNYFENIHDEWAAL